MEDALVRNHREQQADDLGVAAEAVGDDPLAENVAPAEIPGATLAPGAQRVFVEACAVLAAAARVAFREVRRDRADRFVKLARQPEGSFVLHQLRHVRPRYVHGKQRQPVSLHFPQRVSSQLHRHRLHPFFVGHRILTHHASRFRFQPHASRFPSPAGGSSRAISAASAFKLTGLLR